MPRPARSPLRCAALLLLLPLLLAPVACSPGRSEEELLPPPAQDPAPFIPPSQMVVPPEVAAAWRSVVLEVTEKESRAQEEVEIAIGATAPLGKTGLSASVEGFLPHFTMQGGVFTTLSGREENPAARVTITDGSGKELFSGFLFALYPDAHPFDHPRFRVILKEFHKSRSPGGGA